MKKIMFYYVNLIIVCFIMINPAKGQETENLKWMGKNVGKALNEVMPISNQSGKTVSVRVTKDLYVDELEYSINFNKDYKPDRIKVVYRIADSVSIYNQVLKLHSLNPDETIEDIIPKLKVKEWVFYDNKLHMIKLLFSDFYRLNLPMLSKLDRKYELKGLAIITLHPRIYHFKADVSGGNMELYLTDEDHPFVYWADKVKHFLDLRIDK